MIHYRGADVLAALRALAGEEGDPYEGITLAFVNPVTGPIYVDGAAPGDQAFRAAAQAAMSAIDPMEDIINSAEFRRDLVLAVARRALERAAA